MKIYMKTDLFKIGGLTIHGYGFMIALGFILAMILGEYRAKKLGLKDESVIDIAIIAGLTGFAGAKLLFIIVEFDSFIKNPKEVLGSSGFVVYGGIIAGVLCSMLYCKIKKINFLEYFDLIMPEIALAQGFGRIGCFLAGCCYGKETSAWYGVTFPADCLAPAGVSLIPTQLFSAAGDFIFAIILFILQRTLYKKKKKTSGIVTAVYLMLYAVGRFLIEFLRNDPRGAVGVLSTSQFIAIFMFAAGAVMLSRFVKNSN